MNRCLVILSVIILLAGTQAVFAQQTDLPEPVFNGNSVDAVNSPGLILLAPELNDQYSFLWTFGAADQSAYVDYTPSTTVAQAASTDADVPRSIRNNKYFLESVRLTNLAQQAYEEGDYDASTQYSEEAVRNAHLSDDYVRLQLKIRDTDNAIAAARRRLDFAASVNAATRYPTEYSQAQTAYNEARAFRTAESWDEAIDAANRVLTALAYVDNEPVQQAQQPAQTVQTPPPAPAPSGPPPLPAQYTVRPWSVSKDCLWNIAGRPWVYNDSRKWKTLYDANKSKMPEANNPDLIHPGMVLDIPSLKGETRQGMWDSSAMYQPLP